jgi:NADH:ubiquinone oxidoreductase subunit F (NADH-binding)/Pyruvate/2-oxoacid:ferredoxin oxidoreductase delta subunit/(2Fe-2S) ferredoxin
MKIATPEQLAVLRDERRRVYLGDGLRVLVGTATCGLAAGAQDVVASLRAAFERRGVAAQVVETGCIGACFLEPMIDVVMPGQARITYGRLTPDDMPPLVDALAAGTVYAAKAIGRQDAEAFLLEDAEVKYGRQALRPDIMQVKPFAEIPFFRDQMHLAMRNCGFIDPASLEEYIARGGYAAAAKALHQMKPDEIIEAIRTSGLRGRGGGGFSTGKKWETCRKAHGEPKYVICNADEGDPGAYMDRSIIEGDPHSVIEGMIIGSYAVGAHEGYIYVREEYPLAVRRLRLALKQAEEAGLLGSNILGSGHGLTIRINRGAGAFVCGESTALMASLEGRVGEPRAKYVHTVESGLWSKPSCLNNVETWNNVPVIIMRGAPWFASIGTARSKGTKVFSLVGKINNVGLVEVPMGITLRRVIEQIGAGIPDGAAFKAVQTGGPSGGCIPAQFLDSPVDYETLTGLGSMMGSGGMIVMDDRTCMVDVARYFLAFLKDESCGKCVPCREGTARMLDVLTAICEGRGQPSDIDLLNDLSAGVADASLCALGSSAPNPVLTTLKYFGDEYRAHIEDKRCPAKVCRALIRYRILADQCTGCTACAKVCPEQCIAGEPKQLHVIDQGRCVKCGMCKDACRFEAVEVA